MIETLIYDMIVDSIYKFESKFSRFAGSNEVVIMLPDPAIILLKKQVGSNHDNLEIKSYFMGYRIQPGYEMAIVIYHPSCTLFEGDESPRIRVPFGSIHDSPLNY